MGGRSLSTPGNSDRMASTLALASTWDQDGVRNDLRAFVSQVLNPFPLSLSLLSLYRPSQYSSLMKVAFPNEAATPQELDRSIAASAGVSRIVRSRLPLLRYRAGFMHSMTRVVSAPKWCSDLPRSASWLTFRHVCRTKPTGDTDVERAQNAVCPSAGWRPIPCMVKS